MKNLSPFARMLLGAVGGISLGIALGLVFGLLINWIAIQVSPLGPGKEMPGAFLGMGAGAVIGSILGGIYANR